LAENDREKGPAEDARPAAGDDDEPDEARAEDTAGDDAADGEAAPEPGDEEYAEDELPSADEENLPPAPDDGPLRVLPIRHLPLAHDGVPPADRPSAPGSRAGGEATPRAWEWVPLGALIAMATTFLAGIAAVALVPDVVRPGLKALHEATRGMTGGAAWDDAVPAALAGPDGATILRALVPLFWASVLGLLAAGFIAAFFGRARPLEAGLGTGTFVLLSLLFTGVGLCLMAVPPLLLAVGAGALGAWLGRKAKLRRARRRAGGPA
jgi:hypothetical protein